MIALPVLAAALLAASTKAAVPQPVLFGAQARVDVDANGEIVGVERPAQLPPAVADAIEAKIRSLKFEAPQIGGRKVGGSTYVQVQACAVPSGDNYALSVKYRGNGPGQDKNPPPRFPYAALGSKVHATYRLIMDIQADGRAQLESMARTKGGPHNSRDLEAALRDWVAQLHFQPEQLDAKPVSTRLQRDVAFESSGETYTGPAAPAAMQRAAKREQEKSQARQVEQSDACKAAFAADVEGPVRSVALDSPFRLQQAE